MDTRQPPKKPQAPDLGWAIGAGSGDDSTPYGRRRSRYPRAVHFFGLDGHSLCGKKTPAPGAVLVRGRARREGR